MKIGFHSVYTYGTVYSVLILNEYAELLLQLAVKALRQFCADSSKAGII